MARKDEILQSYLQHDILYSKYGLKKEELPETVKAALLSKIPIVQVIALIVEVSDSSVTVTDATLRNQVTQFLNTSIS